MSSRDYGRAVFTAITGGYETLNEHPVAVETEADFICFTDDPSVVSRRWTVIFVPRWFPSDPMRSQRVVKITGHPALAAYDETLYIDNTVRLKADPCQILDEWLANHDLAIPLHSFRGTVRAEFDAVRGARFDTSERLDEQLEHYARDYPHVLSEVPHWNGMIARRRTDAVQAAMEVWLTHVLRYARRDQLSLNVALAIVGLPIERIVLDNATSQIHEWPIAVGRTSGIDFPSSDRVLDLTAQLEGATAQLALVQHQVAELQSSTSWRVTTPFRFIMDASRRLTGDRPKG